MELAEIDETGEIGGNWRQLVELVKSVEEFL